MTLLPGYRLSVAPKFHLEADWLARVAIGAGVEEIGGRFFPHGPWRPLTLAERAVLISEAEPPVTPAGGLPVLDHNPGPAPASLAGAISLFRLPEHLRGTWWGLLDVAVGSGGPLRGFDAFAAQVSEFLAFKRLSAPESTRMEVIVTAAGERSIRRDPDTGRASGLGSTVPPWAVWPQREGGTLPRLHAIVNLGDEPSGVVLLNLPLADMVELSVRVPDEPAPATIRALVERFFRVRPDYPPVRLRLGPGEGCRLPPQGLVLDGDPTGKDEPDVLLLITAGEGNTPGIQ